MLFEVIEGVVGGFEVGEDFRTVGWGFVEATDRLDADCVSGGALLCISSRLGGKFGIFVGVAVNQDFLGLAGIACCMFSTINLPFIVVVIYVLIIQCAPSRILMVISKG